MDRKEEIAAAGAGGTAIVLNGEARRVAARTVAALLEELGLDGVKVAVMMDDAIVKRADRAGAKISAGSRIELIGMVGGG